MRTDTPFDPVFREDRRAEDPAQDDGKAFAFDGWSYQPITAPGETRPAAVPELPR